MLILSRREGENIQIQMPDGQIIKITVHRTQGNQVKLAIEAPKDYPIWREELLTGDLMLTENL